jgi:hypothetical protein
MAAPTFLALRPSSGGPVPWFVRRAGLHRRFHAGGTPSAALLDISVLEVAK